jgi:protein-S-isoprenylcysteine O-methyltransferase Ste14
MLLRAIAAFLICPGTVAFVVPMLIVWPPESSFRFAGGILLAIGSTLLLWCVRDFYVVGRGTLAPWAPPKRLLAVGLYRYSRNPMYLAVLIVLCGWALGYQSSALWLYAAGIAAAFHLRVLLAEEPWLARTFGDEWVHYRARVRRWL